MSLLSDLMGGIVVENTLQSWTGKYLYSDTMHEPAYTTWWGDVYPQYSELDRFASVPLLGVLGGVIRVSLAALHILVHTLSMSLTFDSRHFVHIAKGGCEALKGIIQSIPIVGHLFSNAWIREWKGDWWMIKIYNPGKPDSLDEYSRIPREGGECWANLKASRPTAYFS